MNVTNWRQFNLIFFPPEMATRSWGTQFRERHQENLELFQMLQVSYRCVWV